VPYLSALEVRSRQGTIQIHVYLYLSASKSSQLIFVTNYTDVVNLVKFPQGALYNQGVEYIPGVGVSLEWRLQLRAKTRTPVSHL